MRSISVLVAAVVLAAAGAVPVTATPLPDSKSDGVSLLSSTQLCRSPAGTDRGNRRHGGDLAFVGDLVVALCGNDDGDLYNDGFVIADIKVPAEPRKIGEFFCVASASDLAVYRHLVFLAVDRNLDAAHAGPLGTDCEAGLANHFAEPDGGRKAQIFKGFRIVDISNPSLPTLVASVPANNAGAHNVTVLPQRRTDGTVDEVHVYASAPGEAVNAVVRVPLDAPQDAEKPHNTRLLQIRKVDEQGSTNEVQGCHDVSFFTPKRLGVCNALDKGSAIFRIPRLTFPVARGEPATATAGTLALAPTDNHAVRHHSSAFSHDGDVLVVSDESFATAGTGRCDNTAYQQGTRVGGGVFFFDVSDVPGTKKSAPRVGPEVGYQPPQGVVTGGWCTSINLNVVPTLDGRRLAVVGWYAGGTTVVDFSDHANPVQMEHYIAAPGDPDRASASRGSYWYNGHVYVGNLLGCVAPKAEAVAPDAGCFGGKERGLDVLDVSSVPESREFSSFDFGRQECQFRENPGKPEKGTYTCP